MSWLTAGLEILGAGIGIYSATQAADATESAGDRQAAEVTKAAKANAALSRYDATVARAEADATVLQTAERLRAHSKMVGAVLGTQKAGYAKAGVVVGSGTPLEVARETAAQGARDAEWIRYNGETAAQRRRNLAARYDMLASYGLRDAAAQAVLIQDEADDKATAYRLNGLSTAVDSIYNLWSA